MSRNACVYGNAQVFGDAQVSGIALVSKLCDLIYISNLQFPITVTLQNCAIGCMIKTHREWLKVTQKEALLMGLTKNNYRFFKQLLPILFKKVGKP